MFKEMRRKKQQLVPLEVTEILERNNTCTLALYGENGYPYSLPITYVYYNEKIYLHCAKEGYKLDCIKNCDKVSLSIVDSDEVVQNKYTNKYKSVVIFGNAKILDDKEDVEKYCRILATKVCPNALSGIQKEIDSAIDVTNIIEITIDHMTGKEGLEFFKLR